MLRRWGDRRTGGSTFAERPDRAAPDARLLWTADLDRSVVPVRATPVRRDHPEAFALARFGHHALLARGEGDREHLVLSDGWRRLRIDIIEGTLIGYESVRLDFQLAGFAHLDTRLLTIRRLLALWRRGRFASSLFQPLARLPQRLEALRAGDARAAGASHREIAVALYGEARVRAEWGGRSDSLLMRIRRRVAEARRMERGGYRALFRAG